MLGCDFLKQNTRAAEVRIPEPRNGGRQIDQVTESFKALRRGWRPSNVDPRREIGRPQRDAY
jgi:hypothetical protein